MRSPLIACRVAALALTLLSTSFAQGPTPTLLADINQQPLSTLSSDPAGFLSWGAEVLALTEDGLTAVQVQSGATRDLASGLFDPVHLTAVGSGAIFWNYSKELWRTDGTQAGTHAVCLTHVPAGHDFAVVGNLVLFPAALPPLGYGWPPRDVELGVYDFVADTFTRIQIHAVPDFSSFPEKFTSAGGLAYFSAETRVDGRELWRSDGTVAGTTMVADLSPGWSTHRPTYGASTTIHAIGATPGTVLPSNVLFSATPENGTPGLWRVSATGATQLFAVEAREFFPHPTSPTRVMFSGRSQRIPDLGFELYDTDGQTSLRFVKDIAVGSASSFPRPIAYLPNGVVFSADDRVHGVEPWFTDGTNLGTVLLRDAYPGPNPSIHMTRPPGAAFDMGGSQRVIFAAEDGVHGAEPWLTDGTPGGTYMLADMNNHAVSSGAGVFVGITAPYPGVVFACDGSYHGVEPWYTDGTTTGTRLIADLNQTPGGVTTHDSNPGPMFRFGGLMRFAADDGIDGRELWRTNGQGQGTSLDANISPGAGSSYPEEMVAIGDRLYFTLGSPNQPRQLWTRVGNGAPTRVTSLNHVYVDPIELTPVGELLYFVATNSANGQELWRTDASPSLTFPVDIIPGSASSEPRNLTAYGNRLYFQATDPTRGRELWVRWEGRGNTTQLVVDLLPGIDSSYPDQFNVLGDRLVFRATGPNGREVWSTDGTAAGTVNLVDMNGTADGNPSWMTRAGDRVFFSADDGTHGRELWVTDGTIAGTRLVLDAVPGSGWFSPRRLTALGDRVVFAADDGIHGREPWISDGTAAGTRGLGDIYPGAPGSTPSIGFASGSRYVWFSAEDPTEGRRLWRTDGTTAGTVRVGIVRPGRDVSEPEPLGVLGGRLIFTGDEPRYGREPFAVAAGATTVSHGVGCSGDALVPDLAVQDPVLGATFDVRLRNLRAGGVAMIAMGLPSPFPLRLGQGCWLYTDAAPALFGPLAVTNGSIVWTGLIPNLPVLSGLELAFQGIAAPSTRSIGFDLSQGVLAVIGD